jgi:hypothetical protein
MTNLRIVFSSLVVALAVCGCGGPSDPPASATAPAEDPPPVLVAVAPVEERPATVEETFVGTVIALRTALVASPVEGQVVEFLARKGGSVKAQGQAGATPLVRLRPVRYTKPLRGSNSSSDATSGQETSACGPPWKKMGAATRHETRFM